MKTVCKTIPYAKVGGMNIGQVGLIAISEMEGSRVTAGLGEINFSVRRP